MLIIPVNLRNEEAFHQFGTLTDERMESLFDAEASIDKLSGSEYHISEALAQFPDEDFLEVAIKNLQTIHGSLKGLNNKTRLGEVIKSLEELQLSQARATEYAAEELNKLNTLLEKS